LPTTQFVQTPPILPFPAIHLLQVALPCNDHFPEAQVWQLEEEVCFTFGWYFPALQAVQGGFVVEEHEL